LPGAKMNRVKEEFLYSRKTIRAVETAMAQ
jgi:hypothetical protein